MPWGMSLSAPPVTRGPRRVLVVGATGRLGVRIARALRARNDRLVLTARDAAKLSAISTELGGSDVAKTVCVDLTTRDAPERIAKQVRDQGGIDDMILACGPFPRTPFDGLQREDLERTLAVHAVAPLLLVAALSADLIASEGAVIALGDAGVTRPYENHVAYLTAKGALQTGLRALAVELAPHVRINMVALGIVADPEADADPLRTHRLAARSPLGRFGTPDEVAHVVLALLDATWTTGEIWGIGR
jgi:pteridine reductase